MARSNDGFKGLPCMKCDETDTVRVHVADGSFSCSSCEGEWTLDEARDFLSKWNQIVTWVEEMPKGVGR